MKLLRKTSTRRPAVPSRPPAVPSADVEQALAFLAQRSAWEHLLDDLRNPSTHSRHDCRVAHLPLGVTQSEAA